MCQIRVAVLDPEFRDIVMQLIQDAENADIPNINDLPLSSIPLTQPPVPQAATALSAKISLQLLFDYSTTSPAPGLDFYWKGGLKNLEQKLAAYDLLYGEEDESDGVAKSETNT